jgi:phosphoribosylformylglycinamidine synthase
VSITHAEPKITCEGDVITVADIGERKNKTFRTTIPEVFRTMLAHPNNGSPDSVIRHYDKNIIGNTILEAGEADAGVIAPLQDLKSYVHAGAHPGWKISDEERWRGIAVAGDGNGRYGRISPYLQGMNAAVEAMRNVACVGAKPRALTDCLNYGNPEIPQQLWELQEGVRGIADAANGVHVDDTTVPVVSGNVSFYNGKPDGSAIDPTAIVCCIGIVPDARKTVSMQIKQADSLLFFVGDRKDECGGSAYYQILEDLAKTKRDALLGCNVPHPDCAAVSAQIAFVTQAIANGSVLACHDVSNGGLALALVEMTLPQRGIGGSIGIEADIAPLGNLRPDILLFSETGGFVLEVQEEKSSAIMQRAEKCGVTPIPLGRTLPSSQLRILHGKTVLLSEELQSLTQIQESAI